MTACSIERGCGAATVWAMILVALIVFGLLFFGGVVAIVWIGVFKVDHDQAAAERNAEAILDEAFDGRPDVTFKTHLRSLKYEAVVTGAKERGYSLAHQAGDPNAAMTLMFEKA